MSANDTAPAPQKCPRCAGYMKLVRRTKRFGGLPDLCTFECAACGMSRTEECELTPWRAADLCRKQAKACRDLAMQSRREDRTSWFCLSNGWLKLARDDDQQSGG